MSDQPSSAAWAPVLSAEQFLRAIVETSDDAIISKSSSGIVLSWNAAAERIFGFSSAEAVGQHISLIIPTDRLDEEVAIMSHLLAGRRIERFETIRRHRSGAPVPVELTISPIRNDVGEIIGATKIARDLTVRKDAEARERHLRHESAERDARFKALFEQGEHLAVITDLDGTVIDSNVFSCEGLGFTRGQVIGRSFADGVWWEPSADSTAVFQRACDSAADGRSFRGERDARSASGTRLVFDVSIVPIRDEDGDIVQLAATGIDITVRRMAESALREGERLKDEFLAALSHELRNPLGAVTTSIAVMKFGRNDPNSLERTRAILERQVAQIGRLLDDLLDVSRITRGRLELKLSHADLRQSILDAVLATAPLFEAARVTLVPLAPGPPLHARADAARVQQMVDNLLSNAAKYTPPGGSVRLDVAAEGRDLVVTVSDTGIGIPPGLLEKVFDLFIQVRPARDAAKPGLGIGLSLVKRLAAMHGGTVHAESPGAGGGSTFVLRLPVLVGRDDVASSTADGESSGSPDPRARTARKILVVDDDVDNASAFTALLRVMGHRVESTHDGEQALRRARDFHPDVVFLDLGLPGLDGYETCRRLRDDARGRKLVVAALTGWGQETDRARTHAAGFDHHLVKPVDPAQVMRLLEQLPG